MKPFAIAAILFAAALSACAAAPEQTAQSAERVCFDPDDVQTYAYEKKNTVVVTTRRKESYALVLSGVCPDLESAYGFVFTDVYGARVCSNSHPGIAYRGVTFGPQRCRIAGIERRAPSVTETSAP